MLSAPELLEFLEDQGEDSASLAHAQQLIQTYELNETGGRLTEGLGSDRPAHGVGRSGSPDRWALPSLAVGATWSRCSRQFQTPLPHLHSDIVMHLPP